MDAEWKVGVDNPGCFFFFFKLFTFFSIFIAIVCSGPKYQYPHASDGVHLNATGFFF
jgi:hypothetical protein